MTRVVTFTQLAINSVTHTDRRISSLAPVNFNNITHTHLLLTKIMQSLMAMLKVTLIPPYINDVKPYSRSILSLYDYLNMKTGNVTCQCITFHLAAYYEK